MPREFATRTGPSRNFAAPDGHEQAHLPVPAQAGRSPATSGSAATRTTTCSASTASAPRSWSPTPTRRRVRHDLRRPRRRLQLRRREAGHEGVAGRVPRHERRRIYRPVRRPRSTTSPTARRSSPAALMSSASACSPAPGEMLAWTGDFDPGIEGHGTLTASNVVGQAVDQRQRRRHSTTCPERQGACRGPRRRAEGKARAIRRHLLLLRLLDPVRLLPRHAAGRRRHLQLVRQLGRRQRRMGCRQPGGGRDPRRTADDAACSRRATARPGFGTTTPPAPTIGIKVGASTQFGGTGWDSLQETSQITDNEVMVWSDRGFGANGGNGVDIVADGAYSAGSLTLNSFLNGQVAWETWGGTSRSTPVAAGATALVYQAYRQTRRADPGCLLRTAKRHPQVLGAGPGLRRVHPGLGLARRRASGPGAQRRRGHRIADEWRVGRLPRERVPRLHERDGARRIRHQTFTIDGGPGRGRSPTARCVRTDVKTLRLHDGDASARRAPSTSTRPTT